MTKTTYEAAAENRRHVKHIEEILTKKPSFYLGNRRSVYLGNEIGEKVLALLRSELDRLNDEFAQLGGKTNE